MKCIVNAAFPVHVKVYCLWFKACITYMNHERATKIAQSAQCVYLPCISGWLSRRDKNGS